VGEMVLTLCKKHVNCQDCRSELISANLLQNRCEIAILQCKLDLAN
jgi:hypothetical protein